MESLPIYNISLTSGLNPRCVDYMQCLVMFHRLNTAFHTPQAKRRVTYFVEKLEREIALTISYSNR